MTEEKDISTRTWTRTVDSILKDGYTDGVIDGQNATYQSSFDMGYSQGLQFGLELGLKEAKRQRNGVPISQLSDTRRINCQICVAGDIDRKNIGDLFNIQKEKNDEYLSKSAGPRASTGDRENKRIQWEFLEPPIEGLIISPQYLILTGHYYLHPKINISMYITILVFIETYTKLF